MEKVIDRTAMVFTLYRELLTFPIEVKMGGSPVNENSSRGKQTLVPQEMKVRFRSSVNPIIPKSSFNHYYKSSVNTKSSFNQECPKSSVNQVSLNKMEVDMEKIVNYNCDGLCCEKYCDKKYTHFTNIKINDMDLNLCFCEEHSEKFCERRLLK